MASSIPKRALFILAILYALIGVSMACCCCCCCNQCCNNCCRNNQQQGPCPPGLNLNGTAPVIQPNNGANNGVNNGGRRKRDQTAASQLIKLIQLEQLKAQSSPRGSIVYDPVFCAELCKRCDRLQNQTTNSQSKKPINCGASTRRTHVFTRHIGYPSAQCSLRTGRSMDYMPKLKRPLVHKPLYFPPRNGVVLHSTTRIPRSDTLASPDEKIVCLTPSEARNSNRTLHTYRRRLVQSTPKPIRNLLDIKERAPNHWYTRYRQHPAYQQKKQWQMKGIQKAFC
ncbi:hypothetical protein M3Y98_00239500 [Aphelenchoides besseyi]|nr:hypothetical protein M3Y98_00239500 [Aphelenchoides besseyi]